MTLFNLTNKKIQQTRRKNTLPLMAYFIPLTGEITPLAQWGKKWTTLKILIIVARILLVYCLDIY
jgi:hypothetical protein